MTNAADKTTLSLNLVSAWMELADARKASKRAPGWEHNKTRASAATRAYKKATAAVLAAGYSIVLSRTAAPRVSYLT